MDTLDDLIKDNASETAHLRELVKRLSDAELRQPLEAGWTVSAVLAHMAFWDQRALTLIGKWQKAGVGPSAVDTDVVNEATRILCPAIQPRDAAELAVAFAGEIDRVIAGLTPEMLVAIQTKGTTVNLRRANHRRTHLDEFEKALGL
jgi:Mycothiol maleylpyruvate isomerase N-terminal domain